MGSVRLLKQELGEHGVASKVHVSAEGRRWGGHALTRGALYAILRNRLYIGEVVHRDKHYPGEHKAIIDQSLWDQTQALLTDHASERRLGTGAAAPSLLAGLLFDGAGHRMTPTHAVKKGKRYRYYVSRPLVVGDKAAVSAVRVPAAEIERLVGSHLCRLLADPAAVFEIIRAEAPQAADQRELIERAAALARAWPDLPSPRQRWILCTLAARIALHPERADLHLLSSRLIALLKEEQPEIKAAAEGVDAEPVTLSVPIRLRRIGKEARLIIAGPGGDATPDPNLVRLLLKGHQGLKMLLQSENADITTLARQEGMTGSYFTRLLRLAWLAPDITQAILDGRQPASLTAGRLIQTAALPLDRPGQRAALGFG